MDWMSILIARLAHEGGGHGPPDVFICSKGALSCGLICP